MPISLGPSSPCFHTLIVFPSSMLHLHHALVLLVSVPGIRSSLQPDRVIYSLPSSSSSAICKSSVYLIPIIRIQALRLLRLRRLYCGLRSMKNLKPWYSYAKNALMALRGSRLPIICHQNTIQLITNTIPCRLIIPELARQVTSQIQRLVPSRYQVSIQDKMIK